MFTAKPLSHNMIRILTALSLLLIAAVGSTGEWSGSVSKTDGVAHILNPAKPMQAPGTLKPAELWRLGGESEADEELFGFIGSVLNSKSGDVYVLDSQLSEIRIFSANGEHLRTIGRAGEGPGEFRSAMSMFFLPGGKIGVNQMMPARVAVLGRDGKAYADLPLPTEEGSSMVIIEQAEATDDGFVMSTMIPVMAEGGITTVRSLLALDGEGNVTTTLKKISKESSGGQISLGGDEDENWFRDWRLGADGRIYASPFYEGYKIYVTNLDGIVERIIEMDYERLKRSKEEIAEIEEQNSGFAQRGGAQIQFDTNPYTRDIDSFYPRDNGELWVLSSRGLKDCPEGKLGAFDIFDSKGRYLRRVTLDVDYDGRYDDFRIQGDRLFVIKEANSGPGLSSSMNTGGGHMMMMVAGGNAGDDEEDEREAQPLEIVCYELGL